MKLKLSAHYVLISIGISLLTVDENENVDVTFLNL
jgi:hypothetical protein